MRGKGARVVSTSRALAVALVALGVASCPANAAYPGGNGRIAFGDWQVLPRPSGLVWGGATSMGFPGQRLPIAFRLDRTRDRITELAYASRVFCPGIPETVLALGGHVAGPFPLNPDGGFGFERDRRYGGRRTTLGVAGRVAARTASGTLTEDGEGCTTGKPPGAGPHTWTAQPAFAGTTSQDQPVVAIRADAPDRIARLMLVWSSRCRLSEVTNPNARDTFWLDLRRLRLGRGGRLSLRRAYTLRNAYGDVFRAVAELRGRASRSVFTGSFRATARNIEPLTDGVSETQTARCRSGTVTFTLTR